LGGGNFPPKICLDKTLVERDPIQFSIDVIKIFLIGLELAAWLLVAIATVVT